MSESKSNDKSITIHFNEAEIDYQNNKASKFSRIPCIVFTLISIVGWLLLTIAIRNIKMNKITDGYKYLGTGKYLFIGHLLLGLTWILCNAFVLPHLSKLKKRKFITLCVLFNVLFFISMFFYYKTVFTNTYYHHHEKDLEYFEKGRECKNKCKKPKPPRTHHCSICFKCVQRMDHHCPWVANCIGIANHRYFLMMITSLTCYSWCLVSICTYAVLSAFKTNKGRFCKAVKSIKIAIILMIVAILFGVSMAGFTGFHYYLAMKNATTIEFIEVQKKEFGQYDQGWINNLDSLFCPKLAKDTNLYLVWEKKQTEKVVDEQPVLQEQDDVTLTQTAGLQFTHKA